MRIRTLATVLALTWAFPVSAQIEVEIFVGTATANYNMPGAIAGPNIDFTGSTSITSLDFAPGSVTFQGQPVDFDGTEADFLTSSYGTTISVPNAPGNPVTATGSANASGTAFNGTVTFNGDTGLNLGPTFSESNFELVVPATKPYSGLTTDWQSPVIPELNGLRVQVQGSQTVNSVDAVNGIIDFNYEGNLTVGHVINVPAASFWGGLLLVLGLVGLGAWSLARRSPARI